MCYCRILFSALESCVCTTDSVRHHSMCTENENNTIQTHINNRFAICAWFYYCSPRSHGNRPISASLARARLITKKSILWIIVYVFRLSSIRCFLLRRHIHFIIFESQRRHRLLFTWTDTFSQNKFNSRLVSSQNFSLSLQCQSHVTETFVHCTEFWNSFRLRARDKRWHTTDSTNKFFF